MRDIADQGFDVPSCVLVAFPGYTGPVHTGTKE